MRRDATRKGAVNRFILNILRGASPAAAAPAAFWNLLDGR
jgi:hypothetical protein